MLTDTAIRKTKPSDKPRKMSDGGGMYLLLNPNGSRYWRMDYRLAEKRRTLALGVYPTVSLAEARERREDARRLISQGIDPNMQRQQAKAEAAAEVAPVLTFESVARAWMSKQEISEITAAKNRWLMETYLFPSLAARPIAEIAPRELLAVLRPIEAAGLLDTANRAKIKAGQVFRYAILEGLADNDPTTALRGVLKPSRYKHHAAITDPAKIAELLRAIDVAGGQFVTLCAVKLSALLFVRPGELRHAEWSEFDFDDAIWRIPAAKMKMKAQHLVPLATQAVEILRDLQTLTGGSRFVFPSSRTFSRPMSENTVTAALRRMGYTGEEMTAHGFRSMAATRLNEMGYNADAIERQLAHAEPNQVRAAYTAQAQYLPERTKMMQAWADYLDQLKASK